MPLYVRRGRTCEFIGYVDDRDGIRHFVTRDTKHAATTVEEFAKHAVPDMLDAKTKCTRRIGVKRREKGDVKFVPLQDLRTALEDEGRNYTKHSRWAEAEQWLRENNYRIVLDPSEDATDRVDADSKEADDQAFAEPPPPISRPLTDDEIAEDDFLAPK